VSRIRTITRLVLALSIIMAGLAATSAAAQRPGTSSSADEGSYESELTGLEFTWSDDWELSDSSAGDDDELIQLDTELGFVRTGFATSEDDAEWGRDQVLDDISADAASFEIIDEDTNRDLSWALATAEDNAGEPLMVYVEVVEDYSDGLELVTVVAAVEEEFVDVYELAYDTVEVDGEPILDQFDAGDIEELIGSRTTDDDDLATPSADSNESETGLGNDEAAAGSYVFETEDIEIVVGDDVEIDDIQLEDGSYEQILLVGVGSIGAVSVVQSPLDAESTLDSFMDGFMAEMDDSLELDTGVDGGVAWALYEASVGGMDMHVYVTVDDEQYDGHYLELIAAPVDFFEDEFIAYQESVEINGTSMFDGIDVDDLLDIIDAA
jgi:hypothetical protein